MISCGGMHFTARPLIVPSPVRCSDRYSHPKTLFPCASSSNEWTSIWWPKSSPSTKLQARVSSRGTSRYPSSSRSARSLATSECRSAISRSLWWRVCRRSNASTPHPPSTQTTIPCARNRLYKAMASSAGIVGLLDFIKLWRPDSRSPLPLEHHGLAVVHEHPVLEHIGDSAGEHPALDVAPLAPQVLRRVAVADALDVLFDDRPLVEIGGDEMGRRPDQFDATLMRLVIGLRALESGQERVMDVDAPPPQFGGEAVRQNLHVAGENDEIGFGRLNHLPRLSFLLHLGLLGDWQVVKGNVAEVDVGVGLARIVGDDRHWIHGEFAAAPAIEEVDQAVVETRNHEHDALQLIDRAHRPSHRETGGDHFEFLA